jgi:hypothetical protein
VLEEDSAVYWRRKIMVNIGGGDYGVCWRRKIKVCFRDGSSQ